MNMERDVQPTQPTRTERVQIFDTTLRDGEQSPGATLNSDEKTQIAEQLARLGVDVVEAGFPASSPDDFEAVRHISQTVGQAERQLPSGYNAPPAIAAMARANRRDIEICWEAIKGAQAPYLHIVLPTSDIHMKFKLGKTRDQVIDAAHRSVTQARALCDLVEFSPEDATRSDPGFLVDVLETAVTAGATTLNIPDTVGYAMPEEFGALIKRLRAHFSDRPDVLISVHCHNDLGVATANTLAGIVNGARRVEVTVNGIGERAGNACLEETVMALHTRRAMFHFETNIDRREIGRTSKLVSRLTGIPVQPNKAIVGSNAFSHESGIHQDGILKNRQTYEIMNAAELGLGKTQLVLGKHSGRSALRARLEGMGYSLDDRDLDDAFRAFKALADQHKTITEGHLHKICSTLSFAPREAAQ